MLSDFLPTLVATIFKVAGICTDLRHFIYKVICNFKIIRLLEAVCRLDKLYNAKTIQISTV